MLSGISPYFPSPNSRGQWEGAFEKWWLICANWQMSQLAEDESSNARAVGSIHIFGKVGGSEAPDNVATLPIQFENQMKRCLRQGAIYSVHWIDHMVGHPPKSPTRHPHHRPSRHLEWPTHQLQDPLNFPKKL